jgi:uncharacterized membrane protein
VLHVRYALRGAVIAAIYVALCAGLPWISYGMVQFRVAEALTVLPILYVEAIPGLYVGCLLANIIGGFGVWDIFGGSLVTLIAAIVTYRFRTSFIAYLSPVVLNSILVSAYLTFVVGGAPYYAWVGWIFLGEAVVVFGLGVPLIRALRWLPSGSK